MHPFFAKQLGLPIRPTNIGAQKIDGTMLDTHRMVVVAFSVEDKVNWVRFFEKTFLVANISPKVVFEMPFLTLSGADVDFSDQKLRWRTYITEKMLPTTKYVKLMGKKEFAATTLNPEHKIYVVHIASLSFTPLTSFGSTPLDVHSSRRHQISGLITEEAPTKVLAKYSDFANVFTPDFAPELPKHSGINNYAIELVEGYQQPPYGPIYSLGLVELETLKAYIETNLANGFIKPSKSPARAPILFDQKSNDSLWLSINYRGHNNLTIKN